MAVRQHTPFSCIQHKRFAKQDGWLLRDVTLGNSGSIVVSASNADSQRTLIDIYAVKNGFDSSDKPNILYSKEFEKYSTKEKDFLARRVSFIDPDGVEVVTCLGDKLEVIKVSNHKILLSRRVEGETYCLYVKEREIFVGFWESNSITVFSTVDLAEMKSIILEGIQKGDWPHDITVTAGKIFACVGHADARSNQTSQIFNEENGKILSKLTHPTGTQWYARSLSVNLPTGTIAVVWNNSFYRVEGERWQVVFYHLSETYPSFLIFDVECGVTRIRISDSGERTVTGNLLTGEVKIYNTAELFTYGHLKEGLASQLQREDCMRLAKFFGLSKDYADALKNGDLPTENIFLTLEEKDIIQQSNVKRLTEAFLELKTKSSCYMLADTYQKTRKQATIYSRFLATLSTHLTASLPRDLCVYFNITDEKKRSICSNYNPGLSLLLALDEMGIIMPSEVGALEKPLHEFKLVQAVARIKEYQSIFEERMAQLHKKTELTEKEKKKMFIHCLKKTIKRWYETMTPIPWKKSCRWKSADLFIGRSMILTDSKNKRSLRDIDEKCTIACNKIFSDKRLKSEKRIILEGDPGSGKTMLMSQLAYDWSLGKINEIEMLILLPLKLLQQKSVGQAIKELYLLGESHLSITDVETFLQCEKNCCHLLLDGWEEYSGKIIKGEQSEVMKIMTKAKYPHCKVVITSRSDYVQNLPKYPMLKLRQFGEMERNSYIERVFSDNPVKQMEVKAFITNSSFMLDLCSTPLLFVMAVHNIGRMQNLDKSQLDRISPFMREMIETLCSSIHPIDQTEPHPDVGPSNDCQSEDHVLLHKNAQLDGETEGSGRAPTNYEALNQLKDDHADQSVQDLTAEEVSQLDVGAQTSKGTQAAVKEYNKNELMELPRATTQLGVVTRSNEETQDKSEMLVENEVWSEPKDQFDDFQKTEEKIKKGMCLSLEELAFNGLCCGFQQLSWQSDFVERNVVEIKKWVACGILVTEERLLTLLEGNPHDVARKKLHTEPDARAKLLKGKVREGSMLHSIDTQSEQTEDSSEGEVPQTGIEFQTEIEKSENKDIETRSNQIMTQISLQVKFLHKLIQEWFAAKKLSSLIWKSMSSNNVEECMDVYLQYISPADLHYVLRFTCFLWPPSFHFIVKYLLQNCHSGMSNAHDYILNCTFLCFAEYNGEETDGTLEAIADICNETITIRGEDSRFLQQAKVALLERASVNWIPIKKLVLADVVESASDDTLLFNSGVMITVLDTLEILDVSRWDQTLSNDCSCILKFISKCCSVNEARLCLPHPPPHLDETTLASLRKEDTIVTWILGLKMTQKLDTRTGEWMVQSNEEDAKSMNLRLMDDIGYQGSKNPTVMNVERKISMDGGFLRIPDTDVSLWIPPDALEGGEQHCLIKMRIIPPESFNKLSRVFSSNSSVTVELCPNQLRFKRPIQLTLPHCLQLKKDVDYKARIFMSHQEGGIFHQTGLNRLTYATNLMTECVQYRLTAFVG
ncbi:NACHT, LRR and PYD domains-containing protein 10 [Holothuria leucospilota]|uniref:NACHT, LRR and PYD domains-containing protein 10 n=1 Tax=Holothuria leucospilota TaxID=206669 RepID=A0A9Q1BXP7_HOLLE|nr:NACHT, LRR and PYD domains-containing protein 10 [Holothuria leucospilota]